MLRKGSFKLPPGTGRRSKRELVCFLLHILDGVKGMDADKVVPQYLSRVQ